MKTRINESSIEYQVIRKLHSMPKLLNHSCQINTLMSVSQAADDPELITVSDDHEREQSPVFLSSEKTVEDTPSCYFELAKLKALAVSLVMAIIVAASVILAVKTLGFFRCCSIWMRLYRRSGDIFLGAFAI